MAKQEIVIGIHAVDAVLAREPERVQQLLVAQGKVRPRMQSILDRAARHNIPYQFHDRRELDDISGGKHQGVIAYCSPSEHFHEQDLPRLLEKTDNPLILVLDGVTDPHNLGACLRTADAAGVCAVIIPKDKSAGINETVRKVACGAAETMPLITVTNLARTLKQLQDNGVWVVGTTGDADQSLYDVDLAGPIAIVMGAEGQGMRRLTAEHCDYLARLPMAGFVSSLNVSVATGVCLFEAVRQRQTNR